MERYSLLSSLFYDGNLNENDDQGKKPHKKTNEENDERSTTTTRVHTVGTYRRKDRHLTSWTLVRTPEDLGRASIIVFINVVWLSYTYEKRNHNPSLLSYRNR